MAGERINGHADEPRFGANFVEEGLVRGQTPENRSFLTETPSFVPRLHMIGTSRLHQKSHARLIAGRSGFGFN